MDEYLPGEPISQGQVDDTLRKARQLRRPYGAVCKKNVYRNRLLHQTRPWVGTHDISHDLPAVYVSRCVEAEAIGEGSKVVEHLPSRYGAEFPGDFFTKNELNSRFQSSYTKVDDLWKILIEQQTVGLDDAATVTALRAQTAIGQLFFRGQSNQAHGLSTSLHRAIADETDAPVTEELLGATEAAILNEAEGHGLNKNVSPGELLMILQHHQAPTRLLDVSLRPLEALYFAVERADSKDGRLFVIWLNQQKPIELRDSAELPWAEYVIAGGKAASAWTQAVRPVDERPLDPRMIAQEGRFLVGGVQRAYENLNMWHKHQLRVAERQKISMFCIGFFRVTQRQMPTTKWPALGWTVRIPAAWKPELRERLRNLNISHESMYPDLASIEWRAQRAARDYLSSI